MRERYFFIRQKIEGEIIDYTNSYYGERGHEIQEWLDRHPETESFVILDDGTDMAHLASYLVNTDFANGLEDKHVSQAIEILSKTT